MKEKNKFRGVTLPDFKSYYKATIMKIVWDGQKNMQIDKWNRTESLEIDPHRYSQLIFGKEIKAIQ